MNDLQIKACSQSGWESIDGGSCAWIAYAVNRGLVLLWNEEVIRDLMLAGY